MNKFSSMYETFVEKIRWHFDGYRIQNNYKYYIFVYRFIHKFIVFL